MSNIFEKVKKYFSEVKDEAFLGVPLRLGESHEGEGG